MKQLGGTDMKRLHRDWRRRTGGRLALVLDDVAQPYNVGAILRSAAAYGVERLWLTSGTAPLGSPGARKTALGSDRYLQWDHVPDGAVAVTAARDQGFSVVGLELVTGGTPLFDLDLARSVCLVIGHEDRGLARATLAACDALAYLPLVGRVGSLNVAQATAIALYEVRRQEWRRPPDGPQAGPSDAEGVDLDAQAT